RGLWPRLFRHPDPGRQRRANRASRRCLDLVCPCLFRRRVRVPDGWRLAHRRVRDQLPIVDSSGTGSTGTGACRMGQASP
ncbi:hypothetical protein ABTE05_21020, partial [Acinetobacter baumannii]